MTIVATVTVPVTREAKAFVVSVGPQDFFETYWLAACRELGLTLVAAFSAGITIRKGDLRQFEEELSALSGWSAIHLDSDKALWMAEDAMLLLQQVKHILEQDDAEVFIGARNNA